MGALAAIAKGEVPYTSHAAGHATSVAAIGKIAGDLFPDGSDMGETRALPAIWEQSDKFAQAVQAFQAQSAKLAEVAASGDRGALGAQLGAVGKTCGGCHKPFRKEKK
jgi:cytochrome c556